EIEQLQREAQHSAQNLQAAKEGLNSRESQLQREREARETAETAHNACTEQRDAARAEIEALTEKVAAALAQVERLQAKKAWLGQQRTGDGETASGPQRLRQAATGGRLPGHIGSLMDLIETDPHHEAAIGAVLGSSLEASVVNDWSSVETALELLDRHGGRATLLPLEQMRPPKPLPAPTQFGCIGWAVDLVRCAREHRPAITVILGRAAVCENRAAARRIATDLPPDALAVTLSGEIYRADGATIIGRTAEDHNLAMARETRTLPEKIATATTEHARLESEHRARAGALDKSQAQLQTALTELAEQQEQTQRATEARDATRLELERAQANEEWNRQQLETSHSRLQAAAEELQTCTGDLELLAGKHAETEKQVDEIQAKL
ncbi:MAG: hypothetical protein QGG60_12120, partial [Anaerolineales bacterium]|nr:hypothetical protein [Anaerolineales bacterium]